MKKILLFLMVLGLLLPILLFAQITQESQGNTSPSEELNAPPTPTQGSPTSLQRLRFNDLLNQFRDIKKQLQDTQGKLKSASKEKRAQIQQTIIEKRKEHLLKAIEVLIAHSENLKERVSKNKTIYSDLEQSIISEIDNDITKLNELKNQVNNAKTAEELSQIAQQIKTHRKDIYNLKIRKLLLIANIVHFEKAIVNNAENRAKRISEKIATLKNSGKDVTSLENLLNQAQEKIQQAKNALNELRNEVNSEEITDIKTEEIRKKLNDVKEIIKAVYDLFRQIATSGNTL